MDYGKEFKKFAIQDQGISSTYYDKIVSSMTPMGLTPNIIEELDESDYANLQKAYMDFFKSEGI